MVGTVVLVDAIDVIEYKFNRLMSVSGEQTILSLALYLYHAADRRKRYLQQANKCDNL